MARRPFQGTNFDLIELPVEITRGIVLFVDTITGNDSRTGLTWEKALATVEEACNRLASPKFFGAGFGPGNSTIYVNGAIREQFIAPLGVYGVRIVGAARGRPRHTTSNGVVLTGNGVDWRQSAVAEGAPLLTLREQGWEFDNILFVPESGYSSLLLKRAESATYPDASHAIVRRCKFISGGTQVGYGLEDVGGAYHLTVEDCEFEALEYAWKQTSVGIDSPTSHVWRRNQFKGNKTDVAMNAKSCLFESNYFHTVYHATTHPTTLNLASTANAGVATAKNMVLGNIFADAAADVTIAKGYKPATGDIWRNKVSDTAADIVTVPA